MLNIINNIVKGLKMNVEYIKSVKNDDNRMYFYKDEINEDGYIMRHSTTKLVQLKASICACQIVNFGDISVPCLLTDGMFDSLSKDSQEFIIQHEMGHFNKHYDLLINATKPGLLRSDEMEFQADEYAMEIVGKEIAINALREMQEIGIAMNFGFGKNRDYNTEIERRIENLMNK